MSGQWHWEAWSYRMYHQAFGSHVSHKHCKGTSQDYTSIREIYIGLERCLMRCLVGGNARKIGKRYFPNSHGTQINVLVVSTFQWKSETGCVYVQQGQLELRNQAGSERGSPAMNGYMASIKSERVYIGKTSYLKIQYAGCGGGSCPTSVYTFAAQTWKTCDVIPCLLQVGSQIL